MKYSVAVRECHYQMYDVEAESEDEARTLVASMDMSRIVFGDTEYSHVMDDEPEDYTVTELD